MTEIQPLSPELIRRYLDEDEAEYDVDEDGNFGFEFDFDEDCACTVGVWLSIEDPDTYAIEVDSDKVFARSEWDGLVEICNQWNETERYPMAYVTADDDNPDQVQIVLDYFVYLPSGASLKQIVDLTEDVIDGGFDFWEQAYKEHGL